MVRGQNEDSGLLRKPRIQREVLRGNIGSHQRLTSFTINNEYIMYFKHHAVQIIKIHLSSTRRVMLVGSMWLLLVILEHQWHLT